MSNLQAIADRVEIDALRGEFTDSGMNGDYDRFASLFTKDGEWRIPGAGIEFAGREEIRSGIERLQANWDYFMQITHSGTIQFAGEDTATGRVYVSEFGRLRDGDSHSNFAVYHDRYRRTPDGWKFVERSYEIKYLDSTPLTGTVPESR